MLLDTVRADLQWLRDDGYVETDSTILSGGFSLVLEGPRLDVPHTRVWIGVHPSISEMTIFVGPSEVSLEDGAYSLDRLLETRGRSGLGSRISYTSTETARDAVLARTQGLKLLRDRELANDWTAT